MQLPASSGIVLEVIKGVVVLSRFCIQEISCTEENNHPYSWERRSLADKNFSKFSDSFCNGYACQDLHNDLSWKKILIQLILRPIEVAFAGRQCIHKSEPHPLRQDPRKSASREYCRISALQSGG